MNPPRSLLIALFVVAIFLPPAAFAGQKPPPPADLQAQINALAARVSTLEGAAPAVYDAAGNKVGALMSIEPDLSFGVVRMTLQRVSFGLGVRRDGFFGTKRPKWDDSELMPPVYFDGANCTGRAFMWPLSNYDPFWKYLMPFASVVPPGTTLYVADPAAPPETVTVQSSFGPVSPGCYTYNSSVQGLIPALLLGDISTMFTPPFSVR